MIHTPSVEPHESAAQTELVVLVLAGQKIDELRRARLNSAASTRLNRHVFVGRAEKTPDGNRIHYFKVL